MFTNEVVSSESVKYSYVSHIRKHNEMPHTNISFSPDNTSASRTAQNSPNPQQHIVKKDASLTGACAQPCPFCEMAGLHKTGSLFTTACFICFINPSAYLFTRSGEKVGHGKLSARLSATIGKRKLSAVLPCRIFK